MLLAALIAQCLQGNVGCPYQLVPLARPLFPVRCPVCDPDLNLQPLFPQIPVMTANMLCNTNLESPKTDNIFTLVNFLGQILSFNTEIYLKCHFHLKITKASMKNISFSTTVYSVQYKVKKHITYVFKEWFPET